MKFRLCVAVVVWLAGRSASNAGGDFRIETSRPASFALERMEDQTIRLEIGGGKGNLAVRIKGLVATGSVVYEWSRGGGPVRKVPSTFQDGVFTMTTVAGKQYRIGPERMVLRPRVTIAAAGGLLRVGQPARIVCDCRNPAPYPVTVAIKVRTPHGLEVTPGVRVECRLRAKASKKVQVLVSPEHGQSVIGRREYRIVVEATWEGRTLCKTLATLTTEDEPIRGGIRTEAEAFTAQGGGKVEIGDRKVAASAGKAFLHWDAEGHWLEWRLIVPKDGNYWLVIRYCTTFDVVRRAISFDGKTPSGALASVAFAGTGGWANENNDWNHLVVPDLKGEPFVFSLKKGIHTIRMTNVDGRGLNLDNIVLLPAK